MTHVIASTRHEPRIKGRSSEVKIELEHYSVGAIPVRVAEAGKWEVLAHYFERTPPYPILSEEPMVLERVYKLMTETPEAGENHLTTLNRGLREEFGVKGIPLSVTPCKIQVIRPWYDFREKKKVVARKTTDFLIVGAVENCEGRQMKELEGQSELRWVEINELIKYMEDQGRRYPELPDGNEAAPLEWALAELEEGRRFQRMAETLGKKRQRKI